MVKNRALKRDARVIKASTGITYPRARDLLADPVDQDSLVPSLFLGYGADGGSIVHSPGKSTILVIGGGTGTGKSLLMNRLAAEATDVASVYVIDSAKFGADYRDISSQLSALETTAAGALARVRSLTEARHTASLLVIDEIGFTEDIPGFTEALRELSDSGMPVIIGGQVPHRSLPAALMARADRMILGDTTYGDRLAMFRSPDAPVLGGQYKAILESSDGTVEVILPPGGRVPEPDYSFTFGTDTAGAPATFTPVKDVHLLVTGPTGAGGPGFLRSLAANAAEALDVYVGSARHDTATEPRAVMQTTTLEATADMLDMLARKAVTRQESLWETDVPLRPILIVLDDLSALIRSDPASTFTEGTPEDRECRTRIAVAMGKIAREGRLAAVSLAMYAQTADLLQLIPGARALTVNLSRLTLGGVDGRFHEVSSDLLEPALQALRPGTRQGVYEPTTGKGGLVDIVLS